MDLQKEHREIIAKTSLDSLPDETLQYIVELVGGPISYSESGRSYSRQWNCSSHLRNLRCVNRRLGHLAGLELYRTPNTLIAAEGPLSIKHQRILDHGPVTHVAKNLSLAGTATFFAGLFESRFLDLISLALVFQRNAVGIVDVANDPPCVFDPTALTSLRNALQSLPLRELRIHFQGVIHASTYEHFQLLSLAAGHPTLGHLAMGRPPVASVSVAEEGSGSTRTPSDTYITSLAVRCHELDVENIRKALGSLPYLSKLSIDCRKELGNPTRTTTALTSGVSHSISYLELAVDSVEPELWQSLASFPNLASLTLRSFPSSGAGRRLDLGDACLPNLKEITLDASITVDNAILEQIVQRRRLPSLASLYLHFTAIRLYRFEREAARLFFSLYDGLQASDSGVVIRPAGIRRTIVYMLKTMEERLGLRPEDQS